MAQAGLDLALHDTYYVVDHFHYMLAMSLAYIIFSAIYHWYYVFTGVYYNTILAKIHLYLFAIGSNLTFLPMHFLGVTGMQRRVLDYPSCFDFWHSISTFGSVLSLSSLLWFMAALLYPYLIYHFSNIKKNNFKFLK